MQTDKSSDFPCLIDPEFKLYCDSFNVSSQQHLFHLSLPLPAPDCSGATVSGVIHFMSAVLLNDFFQMLFKTTCYISTVQPLCDARLSEGLFLIP